jgi:predicted transcriptional regulator
VKESPVSLISNSTQLEVYNFIVANPGIQFRGICNALCIAIGTAEFHLGVLKKAGLISFVRDGKYKRFFVSKKFSDKEMKLISFLRHETIGKIVQKLVSETTVSRPKLASHLCITSQGLTWQIKRLKAEGIIKENSDGIKLIYSLNGPYEQALPELLSIIEISRK